MSFSLKLEIIFTFTIRTGCVAGTSPDLRIIRCPRSLVRKVISPVGSAPFGSLIRIYTSWVSGYF